MKYIMLSIFSLTFIMADLHISGDARVRPRYDIKENGDGSSTSDLYYLYRARLNMKADIGDGWFLKTKLGTNSVAGMTKMGTLSEESYTLKPSISFMEIYFGSMKDDWGFWAGAFPLKYNPALDLHFYSDKLVDIPFMLFNNSSITGFSGYRSLMGHKLNWFLSVDNNVIEKEVFADECEDPDGDGTCDDIEDCDNFTLGMDAFLTFGSVSVTPRFLTSFGGQEDDIFPMTYGADLLLPKIAGFSSSLSYYLTTKGKDSDDGHYEGDHMRISLSGPMNKGKLKFFFDLAHKDNDQVSYIWLSYTHNLYKGDFGQVSISPTFRLQTGKGAGTEDFDGDYSRTKLEVTTQIQFK